jgi:hypothetical protein
MAMMEDELLLRSETLSSVFRCCAELGRVDKVSEGFGGRLLIDLLHLTSADWYVLRMLSPDGRKLLVSAASESDLVSETHRALERRRSANRHRIRRRREPNSDPIRQPRALQSIRAAQVRRARGHRAGLPSLLRRHAGRDDRGRSAKRGLSARKAPGRGDPDLRRVSGDPGIEPEEPGGEAAKPVVARELEIAQDIQRLLLPRTLPQLSGFGLAGGWQSAREVGGDFYDAIAIGDQSLLLMIADVMGKGVPAALFATTMRGCCGA